MVTSRGPCPLKLRRMKNESSIVDFDVILEIRAHGWGGDDLPDDVVQVAGSVLFCSDMSKRSGIMRTSPMSRGVSLMAVCGPGSLGSSETITISWYDLAYKISVKRYKLLALISVLKWLASALFT